VYSILNTQYFIVSYSDRSAELRDNKTGEIIQELNESSNVVAIPDSSFFIVYYSDGSAELRDNKTGEIIQELNGNVSSANPVLNTPYFIISYSNAPDELRENATGKLVIKNDQTVANYIFLNQNPFYRVYTYKNGQSELWRYDQLLVQFKSSVTPILFLESNRLAILQDEQIKWIDLEMLENLAGDPLDNPLTGEELIQFACNYVSVPDVDISGDKLRQSCQEE